MEDNNIENGSGLNIEPIGELGYDDLINELIKENEKMKDDNTSLNNLYLRLRAEFENFKKRISGEKTELIKTANEKLILKIIPIIDNFERAKPLSDGVELIYKDFINVLKDSGVKEIICVGDDFDTDKHEALSLVDSELKSNTIIDVIEKGYILNGKVIRFAKVIVSK